MDSTLVITVSHYFASNSLMNMFSVSASSSVSVLNGSMYYYQDIALQRCYFSIILLYKLQPGSSDHLCLETADVVTVGVKYYRCLCVRMCVSVCVCEDVCICV